MTGFVIFSVFDGLQRTKNALIVAGFTAMATGMCLVCGSGSGP